MSNGIPEEARYDLFDATSLCDNEHVHGVPLTTTNDEFKG